MPDRYLIRGEKRNELLVDTSKKEFRFGKVTTGTFLLGPGGVLGDTLGKKRNTIIVKNAILSTNTRRRNMGGVSPALVSITLKRQTSQTPTAKKALAAGKPWPARRPKCYQSIFP